MNKFVEILRYIFCIPGALICAVIISGIVSIVQNLISSVACSVMFLRPFFVDCSKDFNQRTFLADVVLFVAFVLLTEKFAPKYKKQIAIGVLILCILFNVTLTILLLSKNMPILPYHNILLPIGLIIWCIVMIKDYKS